MIKKIIHSILQLFYPLFKKVLPYDVYAYLAVGAVNTAANILLFASFYQYIIPQRSFVFGSLEVASYTICLIIAFLATVPSGFWMAKHFAFDQLGTSVGQTHIQLGRYFVVVLQGLLLDYLLFVAFIICLSVHPTAAKISSTIIVISLNYLLQKYFTFSTNTQV